MRGSKQDKSGEAPRLSSQPMRARPSSCWSPRGRGRDNEVSAIPELRDLLAIAGAIMTIDAIGTRKVSREDGRPITLLALKENQGALYADVADFFADPALAAACRCHKQTEAGHGRIEERIARAAAAARLAGRHAEWPDLCSIPR